MEKLEFLLTAKKAGYASGGKYLLLPDGRKQFVFESKDFKYVDVYYGQNPFGGYELLSKKCSDGSLTPVWAMGYGGSAISVFDCHSVEVIFSFLKSVLLKVDEDHPYRGPEIFETDNFLYKSKFSGSPDCFSGNEEIYHYGVLVYFGNFFGGMLEGKEALDAISDATI